MKMLSLIRKSSSFPRLCFSCFPPLSLGRPFTQPKNLLLHSFTLLSLMAIYFQVHRPNSHFFRQPLLLETVTSVLPQIHLCFSSSTRCSRPSSSNLLTAHLEVREEETKKKRKNGKLNGIKLKLYESQMKEKWLESTSCPFDVNDGDVSLFGKEVVNGELDSEWIVGVDPDTSGAIALLKPDGSGGFSAQVFDTPFLQVLVGKRSRKRPDAREIVLLLQSLGAPLGTIAYIEQSTPFPKDGKQGWWSGGYTYGLWTGVLVASGFSVVPVTSRVWKNHFGLSGKLSNKDNSRETASLLFPSASSSLGRKKDHGRAEALLIAAYGKGIRPPEFSSALKTSENIRIDDQS